MDEDVYANRAIQRLHEAGERITPARARVIHLLGGTTRALMVHEILAQLTTVDSPYDRMTLYRTLGLLEQHGLIHQLTFCGGYVLCRFDAPDCHHQLVCRACRHVGEVSCRNWAGLQKGAPTLSPGFRVEHHLVEFIGLCSACLGSQQADEPEITPADS